MSLLVAHRPNITAKLQRQLLGRFYDRAQVQVSSKSPYRSGDRNSAGNNVVRAERGRDYARYRRVAFAERHVIAPAANRFIWLSRLSAVGQQDSPRCAAVQRQDLTQLSVVPEGLRSVYANNTHSRIPFPDIESCAFARLEG